MQAAAFLLVHEAQLDALVGVAFQAAPFRHAPGDPQGAGGHVPEIRPGLDAGVQDGREVEAVGRQEVDDAGPRIVPHRQVQERQHGPDAVEAAQGLPGRGVKRDAVLGEDFLDPRQVGVQGARHHPDVLEVDSVLLHAPEDVLGHGQDLVTGSRAVDDLGAGARIHGRTRLRPGAARRGDGSRAVLDEVHDFVRPGEASEVTVVEVLGEGPVRVPLDERIEQGHRVAAGNAAEELQLALGQVVEAVVADAPELPQVGRRGRMSRRGRVEVLVVLRLPLRETALYLTVQLEEVAQRVAVAVAEEPFAQRLQGGLGIHHGVLEVPQALPQRGTGSVVLHDPGETAAGRDHSSQRFFHERLVAQHRARRALHFVEQVQAELEEGEDVEVQQVQATLPGQQHLHTPAKDLGRHHEKERSQRVVLSPRPDLFRQGVFQLGVVGTENDLHGAASSASFDSASLRSGRTEETVDRSS